MIQSDLHGGGARRLLVTYRLSAGELTETEGTGSVLERIRACRTERECTSPRTLPSAKNKQPTSSLLRGCWVKAQCSGAPYRAPRRRAREGETDVEAGTPLTAEQPEASEEAVEESDSSAIPDLRCDPPHRLDERSDIIRMSAALKGVAEANLGAH